MLPSHSERGVKYEIYRVCGCGYAVQMARKTEQIKECPLCGGTLTPKRVDYPDA